MKKIVFLLFVLLFCFLLSVTAFADTKEEYQNGYSIIQTEEFNRFLEQNKNDYIVKNGIDIKDYDWVNKVTAKSIFDEILSIVKSKSVTAVKVFFSLVSVIFIVGAAGTLDIKSSVNKTLVLVAVLAVSLIVSSDIWGLITSVFETIKNISKMMLLFVPVFSAALFSSGKALTSISAGANLTLLAQGILLFSSEFLTPLLGGFLAVSMVSSITPFSFVGEIGKMLKRVTVFLLSLIFTVFVGIMGLQTSVNSAADTLSIKTTKFIVGSFVPIGGGALSDATNMIYSSMSLIKSSVGVYGILIIALMCLPVIIEILLLKSAVFVPSVIAKSFGNDAVCELLCALNSLLSVVFSFVLFSSGIFIFSVAVGLSAGGV
ncbi:MAG: hypothetical protein MJ080_01855 [Clostridia bacterium]|nr:hypothetical protein [Clostridia bacterium]